MPHWLIKSAVHRTISLLPRSHWWNDLLQTHITKSQVLTPAQFSQRLDFCRTHLEHFFRLSPARDQFFALELGTGWFPIVPIGLFLCGASEVWTYDIAPLLQPGRVVRTLKLFREFASSSVLLERLPRVEPERLKRLLALAEKADAGGGLSPRALLEPLGIHAFVQDARSTGLPPGSVDFFVSTSVLEYIPRSILSGLFREFHRLSREDAVMCHEIGLMDEFADFDRSITSFNFLKFSKRRWKYLNSPLIPQTRLRISDYRQVITESGFEIVSETNTQGQESDLAQIRLAPEFRGYSKADLLVIRSWIAARPVPSKPALSGAACNKE